MKVITGPGFISGFYFVDPLDDFPALSHCGEALCSPNKYLEPHRHKIHEFIYMVRGTTHWRIGKKNYTVKPGEMIIAYPNEPHESATHHEQENHQLWVGIRLTDLGEDGARLLECLKQSGVHHLPDCHEIEHPLRLLIQQVATDRPSRSPVIRIILRTFAALVEQRVRILGLAGGAPSLLPLPPAIDRAMHLLQRLLDRRVPLPELAAAAGYRSVPSFCAHFQAATGRSPSAYHLNLRLDAARRALQQPGASVTQVALDFGFSSSQHLSALFKRHFGTTATQWRRKTGRP